MGRPWYRSLNAVCIIKMSALGEIAVAEWFIHRPVWSEARVGAWDAIRVQVSVAAFGASNDDLGRVRVGCVPRTSAFTSCLSLACFA